MCFERDAHPPDLPADLARGPLAGGAAAEQLELTAADGARFSAALASSDRAHPPGAGVVILPDVRGLYRFYAELAERFAQAGHHAIAIDFFGRTAGTGERGDDFDAMPHVMQTKVAQVQADVAAARDALRERTGAAAIVTVGFCFGGLQSFLAATNPGLALDGAVAFYGVLTGGRSGAPSVLEHAHEIRCPVLAIFGGADAAIPLDQVRELDRRLDEAGVEHEVVVYPGAPHSFFDRSFAEHAEASEDAWRRVLGFLDEVARVAP